MAGLHGNQKRESLGMAASFQGNTGSNLDFSEHINYLKKAREENERSKDAQEIAEPKEIAKSLARAAFEAKQHELVEEEARKIASSEAQTALMDKTQKTTASPRNKYPTQTREKFYARHDKTAAAHKQEMKLELLKRSNPEIMAALSARYAVQAKDEVTKQEQGESPRGPSPIDEVQEEASPSSARGVKHSFEQEYDEENRDRSLFSGEENTESEDEQESEVVDTPGSTIENAIDIDSEPEITTPVLPRSALRGIKRSFDHEPNEDEYSGRSSKRVHFSDEEQEEANSGVEDDQQSWSFDTRRSLKEDGLASTSRSVKQPYEEYEEEHRGSSPVYVENSEEEDENEQSNESRNTYRSSFNQQRSRKNLQWQPPNRTPFPSSLYGKTDPDSDPAPTADLKSSIRSPFKNPNRIRLRTSFENDPAPSAESQSSSYIQSVNHSPENKKYRISTPTRPHLLFYGDDEDEEGGNDDSSNITDSDSDSDPNTSPFQTPNPAGLGISFVEDSEPVAESEVEVAITAPFLPTDAKSVHVTNAELERFWVDMGLLF